MDAPRFSLRVIADPAAQPRAYVRRDSFDIGAPLTFDVHYAGITALDYLLGAVAGGIVSGMQESCRRNRIGFGHIEAVIHAELHNALISLGVVGETGDPGIRSLELKVYVETTADEADVRRAWEEMLRRSPLWHTFKRLTQFNLNLEIT